MTSPYEDHAMPEIVAPAVGRLAPIAAFRPISLAGLNASAEMLRRRDNKYVVEQAVMIAALEDFSRHFDVLEIDGRRAFTYDTCYFDSAGRECYFDHHRGRRRRAKVRIRNYCDAGLSFVEVKLKDKRGETIKKRLAYDPADYGVLDTRALDFVQTCYHGLYGTDFPYELHRALDMRYKRVTLVAKAGGERMTIDNGLHFMCGTATQSIDDGIFIVETKSANGNGIADKILRGLHRHPMKHCSKYCAGTAMVGPSLKTNNFRQILRKLVAFPDMSGGVLA
jgi:VTC domain